MKLRDLIGFFVVVLILAGAANGRSAETALGSEQEWERTVNAAEQEGQVVVYKISHDSEWLAFQKRFPKIKVVLIQGNAAQIQQRLLAELPVLSPNGQLPAAELLTLDVAPLDQLGVMA